MDQYKQWRDALENKDMNLTCDMTAKDAPSGFWRIKNSILDRKVPVAIWRDSEGALLAQENGEDIGENRLEAIWQGAMRDPITESQYKRLVSATDDILFQRVPEEFEDIVEYMSQIEAIDVGDDLELAADVLQKTRKIKKAIDEYVKAETGPHTEMIKHIKASASGPYESISSLQSSLKSKLLSEMLSRGLFCVRNNIGNAVSLKARDVAKVSSRDEALAFFTKNYPHEFDDLIEKLARKYPDAEGVSVASEFSVS